MKKISDEVLAVLDGAEFDGFNLRITQQLERKLYTEVNKALVAIGGKWNRSAKAHVFIEDAKEVVERLILLGGYEDTKKNFQQFDTPEAVVEMIFEEAEIGEDHKVLEPSAGLGAISRWVDDRSRVSVCEIDEKRLDVLVRHGYDAVMPMDFLKVPAKPYFDRVVMNPPFAGGADCRHVLHAYEFLKPGGRLVAIMSPGFTFRQTKPFTDFAAFVWEREAKVIPIAEGAFKDSGTNVRTVMVVIDKP